MGFIGRGHDRVDRKKHRVRFLLGGLIFLSVTGFSVHRASGIELEEPLYQVVEQAEDYEIRLYEPYIVAETLTTGDFGSSGNKAFRILAGYIFGKNETGEKMSMTAPVESSAEAIPGIKLITQAISSIGADEQEAETGYRYRFMMESKYTLDTLPTPLDSRVELVRVEPRLVAVKRCSGSWKEEAFEAQKQALDLALKRDGYGASAEPQFARYNSPFTPSFLRRSEVIIPILGENRPALTDLAMA